MADVTFYKAGFNELRTDAATKALVKEYADEMGERANAVPSSTDPPAEEPYYQVFDGTDGKRARYRVATVGERADKHEAATQALQKAL